MTADVSAARRWLDRLDQAPADPPDVPAVEPPGETDELREQIDGTLLEHWRTSTSGCHCGGVPLGHSYTEHVADAVLSLPAVRALLDDAARARAVLIDRALPLLARARRAADHAADPDAVIPVSRETWETLADDIAALIGHSVTDQPPAPELAAILDGEQP